MMHISREYIVMYVTSYLFIAFVLVYKNYISCKIYGKYSWCFPIDNKSYMQALLRPASNCVYVSLYTRGYQGSLRTYISSIIVSTL